MMPSTHETAIAALVAALTPHPARVLREAELPHACPANGLINVQPADPDEGEQHLGTGTREFERDIDLECVVQGSDAEERDAGLDALMQGVAALLLADRSLGGAVTYLRVNAPQGTDVVPMDGAESLKGAVLPVTIYYETPDNPME